MINIIEAQDLLDNKMTDDERDFLLQAREGVALYDADDKMMKKMQEYGLVDIIPFDHPRAHNSILGVVPTEDGVKVLNVLDDRKWGQASAPISSEMAMPEGDSDAKVHAQDLQKDNASSDGEIPADDPRNVRTETANQEAREDQEAKFESGNKKAKAKDLDKNYRAAHENKTEEK